MPDVPPFLHGSHHAEEAGEPSAFGGIRMPAGVEPAAVMDALLENAAGIGAPVAAHLWLEDPTTATLRLIASSGPLQPDQTPLPTSGTLEGRALDAGSALLEPASRVTTAQGGATIWRFVVPLEAAGARGVAALDIASGAEPDRGTLTRVASALRGALTGALALHVAREETRTARTLIETAGELSRILDPEQVVDVALTRAMRLSGAHTGSIMLLGEDGSMTIAQAHGLPDAVVSETRVAPGEGIAGWVLTSGQPLVVEDLGDRTPVARRHGVRSAVSVPIADADGALGVLNVGSRRFHARFSQSHLDALETVGRLTAVALRNARAVQAASELYFDTLKALVLALETKDPYAQGGTDRVVSNAVALGEYLGLDETELHALRIAAMLHDIGMTAAGDVVTVSRRPLSTVEWGMLKMHPVIAAEILEQAPALREVVPIVYHHHEHYDGRGYVLGLAGENIPRAARILAVADAYVAMTSDRAYRGALTHAQALEELKAHAGTQFDPAVVKALDELFRSREHTNDRS